jgi:hypothetical protein
MSVSSSGACWLVVSDPTHSRAIPGDFYQRLFRRTDLDHSAHDRTWPDGIRFRHLPSGRELVYQSGKLQRVRASQAP